MGWLILLLLAVATMAAMILIGRLPRAAWEMTGVALLLGLAGYAWQGNPSLAGSPRAAASTAPVFDAELAARRDSLGARYGKTAQWLTMSDGLARQGDTRAAANILVSALKAQPDSADLWIGMGNALFTHAGNVLTPAAEYAYRRALALKPDASAPAYFYGLALARSGELEQAVKIWGPLFLRLPDKSPLKAQLARDILQIRNLLEGGTSAGPGR